MRKRGLASLGFFYHDHNEDEKRSLRGLLSSVLVQLCHQSDSYCDILSKFFTDHWSGSRSASDDDELGLFDGWAVSLNKSERRSL